MPKTRGAAAIVLVGMLCVACGRSGGKQQAGQDGAVGTAGRTARDR